MTAFLGIGSWDWSKAKGMSDPSISWTHDWNPEHQVQAFWAFCHVSLWYCTPRIWGLFQQLDRVSCFTQKPNPLNEQAIWFWGDKHGPFTCICAGIVLLKLYLQIIPSFASARWSRQRGAVRQGERRNDYKGEYSVNVFRASTSTVPSQLGKLHLLRRTVKRSKALGQKRMCWSWDRFFKQVF